jgi:hypothetical protein
MSEGEEEGYLEDCLNSLLCVGGILLALLIEKLKLVVMGEIWSRHLSFATIARRCFLPRLSRGPFRFSCVCTLLGRQSSHPLRVPLFFSHPFSDSEVSRDMRVTHSTRLSSPVHSIRSCLQEQVYVPFQKCAYICLYDTKSTATVFCVDLSPTMGATRTLELPSGPDGETRTKEVTHLQWSLQFAMLKIQEMVGLGLTCAIHNLLGHLVDLQWQKDRSMWCHSFRDGGYVLGSRELKP